MKPMSNSVVYTNISKLYTMQGGKRIKEALDNPEMIENAYLKVKDGIVTEVGAMRRCPVSVEQESTVDLNGRIVLPGFIDAHSHLVFGGDRTHEYAMKIKGASYIEIYEAGGGIHSTVKATRNASFDELYETAKKAVDEFLASGVTTLEAKSGYGLDKETELKQLKVVKKLNETGPVELVSTFMPAHALPKEYENSYDYFDYIIKEVLPVVKEENLAEFMDCFLEKGVFSAEEANYILEAGKKAGLKIKIHIDEIEDIGGVDSAVRFDAVSVEHCMVTTPESMDKLVDKGIAAVILPATSFNLCKDYADVATMKEKGVLLALSCDYNPGSCPCNDPVLMARIASRGCHLTPNEVLAMMTINAACAINREDKIGSLEKGKQADFIVMNADSFDEVIANLRKPPIEAVYKKGVKVVDVYR